MLNVQNLDAFTMQTSSVLDKKLRCHPPESRNPVRKPYLKLDPCFCSDERPEFIYYMV